MTEINWMDNAFSAWFFWCSGPDLLGASAMVAVRLALSLQIDSCGSPRVCVTTSPACTSSAGQPPPQCASPPCTESADRHPCAGSPGTESADPDDLVQAQPPSRRPCAGSPRVCVTTSPAPQCASSAGTESADQVPVRQGDLPLPKQITNRVPANPANHFKHVLKGHKLSPELFRKSYGLAKIGRYLDFAACLDSLQIPKDKIDQAYCIAQSSLIKLARSGPPSTSPCPRSSGGC